MIRITRLNGEEIIVNSGLIEFIEKIPDTMISLTTGRKITARESVDEVLERITNYEGTICTLGRMGRREALAREHRLEESS